MSVDFSQTIIDKLFEDNPNLLVNHHLDSFNEFFKNGIKRILREKNPIRIMKEQDIETGNFNLKCNLYLAGKDGNKIYYGKPIIFDDGREHFMYPNEARLRNMTYGITIHYDVDLEFFINEPGKEYPKIPTHTSTLTKMFLGRFPIMLFSDLCVLKNMASDVRFEMGECKNEHGGYFIIDGKEKVIVSQEKFADNMLYVRNKLDDLYSHSADIRSVSEDASKPIRTLSVRILSPSAKYSNNQIVVILPNVRKPVPLFIVMRALGVLSDKSIIEHCLLDLNKYKGYIDLFIPCVHDAGMIFSREQALKYIATFTKHKTIPHAIEILTNYFLPHIGEMNFTAKAYYLGHMVRELLRVFTNDISPTDRDNFRFKRVELPGDLLYGLFNEHLNIQQKSIYQKIDKEYTYKKGIYRSNFIGLIEQNYREFFEDRSIETGFRKAFKGNWGADASTKRIGVVQPLNRLSYSSALSHLRKINLPLDASAKIVGPRRLHSSQWGIIDPFDTPDGGNIGLHKHMSIAATITTNCSGKQISRWLRDRGIKYLEEGTPSINSLMTKVMVNGNWIGVTNKPREIFEDIKESRKIGVIPLYTSVHWDISNDCIFIYTDSGRICRPVFYIGENGKVSYDNPEMIKRLKDGEFTWNQLTSGFSKKLTSENGEQCEIRSIAELYGPADVKSLNSQKGIIEYIDASEEEGLLIAFADSDLTKKSYTNVEIHPSLILGIMGNQVVFPENNPFARNLFACGQMRQAISLYHSNHQTRFDKMGVVLNYGQTPLVKSRYLEKITNEQHPYGENVIVAIMCYGGYNVEDSILFNEGSIKRGLFRTTYFNMYETKEESSTVNGSQVDSKFANVEKSNVVGTRNGYDYSELDEHGLIKENTLLDERKILIGKITTNNDNPHMFSDASIVPKKGQTGYVDKSFITEGEEGFRLAKVRVRDERIPSIGDKFCSRCGQKGTIGLVIPEANMPFTKDGIRPDIIINPHALPTRMTIGQLVETLMGKACAMYGGFGDCTAFMNKGQKATSFGKLLTNVGFNSSGNQILYNGESGEQIGTEIFIGPTYYMRLKHMVKDKINHRAKGPRTILTRQTVQGRANDGGLRIGEMERDGVAGHGAAHFLQESLMVRGDQYYMAICNKSGMTAVYNQSHNLFLSPIADGPIRFAGTLDNGMNIENITKYGRSFSIIKIPYAFKLLMQELGTMNVQMRLITEENIDQLSSMSFSDNIIKLTGESKTEKAIAKRDIKIKDQAKINKTEMKPPPQEDELKMVQDVTKQPLSPTDLGWEFDNFQEDFEVYNSLIIGDNGLPSELWIIDEHDFKPPNEYPKDWITSDLVLSDGRVIDDAIVISGLLADRSRGNWKRVISKLNPSKYVGHTPYQPMDPLADIKTPSAEMLPPIEEVQEPLYNPQYTPPISPPYNRQDTPPSSTPSPPYNPLDTPPASPPYNVAGQTVVNININDKSLKESDKTAQTNREDILTENTKEIIVDEPPASVSNSLLFKKPTEQQKDEVVEETTKKTVKFSQ